MGQSIFSMNQLREFYPLLLSGHHSKHTKEATMPRIEIDLIIDRPIGEIFAFLSNAENLPRWKPTALEVRKSFTGPLAVGSIFKGRFTFLGRPFDGSLEVIVHEPNRRYAMRMVEGPFTFEAQYILNSTKLGTWLTFIAE